MKTWRLFLFLFLISSAFALLKGEEDAGDTNVEKEANVSEESMFSLPSTDNEESSVIPELFGGIFLALVGVIFLLFGYKYLKKILFLIGASAGATAAYTLLLNFEKASEAPLFGDARVFVFAAICLGCGLIVGAVALALWRVGLVIAGGLGGLTLGVFLLSLPPIDSLLVGEEGSSSIFRPIILAIMVGIGGFASMFYEPIVIMASTSMFGAGCICICIDIYAKTGFRDAIRTILQNRGSVEMNGSFIGLLVSYSVLSIAGFYLQSRGKLHSSQSRHVLVADQSNPVYKV